jgi:Domain of unknown function (DUF4178)
MNAESRRVLGHGLLAGASGIVVLVVVWLAVSGVQAGGFVLGLLLLFVLAGPLAALGWYLLASGRAEGIAEQAFVGKRRVVDADRLFRDALTPQLRQLAQMPELPGAQLLRIADGLDRTVKDESAWYDAIQLDDAQLAVLKQYDDLVWERARWLRDHAGEETGTLTDAVDELQAAIDQRADLLLRGRRPPAVAPGALLQAPQPTPESTALVALALGDAVSRDGTDYLVDGLATSSSDGQTWKLAHLTPSGANAGERWLSISPAGLELAWLQAIPVPEPGAKQLVFQRSVLELADTRSSIVRVATTGGSAPGVLVRSWSYRSGSHRGLVEQWPDGTLRAYAGRSFSASVLELWPASHMQEVSRSTP